jgi:polygalacturonase
MARVPTAACQSKQRFVNYFASIAGKRLSDAPAGYHRIKGILADYVHRPDHFIVVNKVTGNSVIKNLYIRNWPTHLFSISSCSDLVFQDLVLNNSLGDAPNSISKGLPAAHNSDGFDVSSSSNIVIERSVVHNQDDCVAITSGNNMTVSNLECYGGHGLSIGSVGGKSNNNVTNILVGWAL